MRCCRVVGDYRIGNRAFQEVKSWGCLYIFVRLVGRGFGMSPSMVVSMLHLAKKDPRAL